MTHTHVWVETSRRGVYAGERVATFLRCRNCGRRAFRLPPSLVVYLVPDV